MRKLRAVLGGLALAGTAGAGWAQCAQTPGNPQDDTQGAAFGASVVMSADGTIALAGGPGFDLGDGVVRTFERMGETWVEGVGLRGQFFTGEAFGSCVSLSADGRTAVVTAPRESGPPTFAFAAGGVYLYERDAMTGAWARTERWTSPSPGMERNFGASCAISPDGNTIVIGETNILGSEFQSLPDAAWVIEREGDAWGEVAALAPSAPIDNGLNYGRRVSISADGSLIVVSAPLAPPFTDGASGRVCVFEKVGGVWTNTDTLTRPVAGASFNSFGDVIAFDGDTLLVVNPFDPSVSGNGTPGPPICFYERSGAAYPAAPDRLLFGVASDGPIVVRGDSMFVGRPLANAQTGEVVQYGRDGIGWTLSDRFVPDEPQAFARYGAGIAVSDDLSQRLIGEPGWAPSSGLFGVGRVHFPGRVFGRTPFEVDTESTFVSLDVSFPGAPFQQFIVEVQGFFDLFHPEACVGLPSTVSLMSGQIRPVQESFKIMGPMGVELTYSSIALTLEAPSETATVDPFGNLTLEGYRLRMSAVQRLGKMSPKSVSAAGTLGPVQARIVGGGDEPMRLEVPNYFFNRTINIGLGKGNPSVTFQSSLMSEESDPCAADLAEPFGVLNFDDVLAFLTAFGAMDPAADLAPAFGALDFDDVLAFLVSFGSGCP